VGTRDPNPRHAGRGIRLLRRRGVAVTEGILGEECRELIAPFRKWILTGRPYVTLKLGVSLDGRIADRSGRSRWITGPESRAAVQRLRHRADAVMAGSGTVIADDPSLLCRACSNPHGWRVVVDARGRVQPNARVLNDAAADRTILATVRGSPAERAASRRRCQTWTLPRAAGSVSLRRLLRRLGGVGLMHVVCEGGGRLAHALVRAGEVDELVFFVAPLLLGGDASVAAIAGAGWPLGAAPRLRILECCRVGADVMIRAVPEKK
jgi:diaminohydroxyphosphoribosylaminopyrimidine deaminase/5-amino-6-(5-phosphoribosylamino)uracil reductase